VKGDGKSVRSYLYASDLAIWLWTILFKGKPDMAYNVGSDEALSTCELANSIGEVANCPVNVAGYDDGSARSRYVPSSVKAKTDLCLEKRICRVEAVTRSMTWIASR